MVSLVAHVPAPASQRYWSVVLLGVCVCVRKWGERWSWHGPHPNPHSGQIRTLGLIVYSKLEGPIGVVADYTAHPKHITLTHEDEHLDGGS
jgi:hypothetical protein